MDSTDTTITGVNTGGPEAAAWYLVLTVRRQRKAGLNLLLELINFTRQVC